MKKLYILLLAGILATATSCTYTFPEAETPTSGSADFSKVVAVGNSLTAGYMNGALYDDGQAASYANIVAQQMKTVGGGEFIQPDINAKDGYFGLAPDGVTILGRLRLVNPTNPVPSPIVPGQAITDYSGDRSKITNFGVPGIRVIDAGVNGYGMLNPYYGRFASNPASSNVLADAVAANGSFFIFWLGGNDALGYALAGATGKVDGDGSNTTDMTPVSMFTAAYSAAIDAMMANGASGIVANVPSINDIPHFTTVPWNAIPMDQATADATNAAYTAYNAGLAQFVLAGVITQDEADLRTIEFKEGDNGAVITDEELTDLTGSGLPSMRMTNSSDLITLSAGSVLGTLADPNNPASVIGVGVPLDEKYTLTKKNQEDIANRIADFNAAIKNIVDAKGNKLALLDINAIFAEFAKTGTTINGAGMDASIAPPFGAFSLDGVHPNQRGSAYVASLFIDKINEVFDANIPNVNPNNWPGNALPVPE